MAFQPLDTVDPFTQIWQAIRETILADSVLGPLIPQGNFPDMTAAGFQQLILKQSLNPGDVPQVWLLQDKFRLRPRGGNSVVGDFRQNYLFMAAFQDQNVVPLNTFKFRLLCAFSKTDAYLGLSGLVRGYEITDGTDDALGLNAIKMLQNRWSCFGTIAVDGYVARSVLATA